ncbi:3-dehydroquinate synthase [Myroides pelagicus]|uniref:3-dehydroquinate synthase n=1 Tax=Myroides pelagicus TaxID=270914 RepID=UPI002DB83341|nr:3-dehydroquinate synthase [Myroides pelagicus]MEC4114586.1 3-dehydroquinate synthase [Myroides pelagicus]
MEIIQAQGYDVAFGNEAHQYLGELLNQQQYSKLIILTDTNCNELCMPYFLANLPTTVPFEIIEIEPGEEHKNLQTVESVIQAMLELGADRKSAILTVGGGVITDLGGFVASVYMRGIDCYNTPTTLLSMVDASVGGKTGVDLGSVKNCVGTFSMPKLVIVDVAYLDTLEAAQLKSGYAEMLKHGLICDKDYYMHLRDIRAIDFADLETFIMHSVAIKNAVVSQDPKEGGLRKILNFGHTIGHAIESYHLSESEKETLLHGEAIAIGMVLEAYLSMITGRLSQESFELIKTDLMSVYTMPEFTDKDIENILEWLKFDKKNEAGEIKCVFLEEIGGASFDNLIDKNLIFRAFRESLKEGVK